MNKNEIIERLGADDWGMVESEYRGKNLHEIKKDLTIMWPYEPDNEELAQAIYAELS